MAKIVIKNQEAERLSRVFGFRSTEDFIKNAVKEKVNRLKAVLFSRTAEKARRGLEKSGITEEEVLRNFERVRHSSRYR